MKRLKKALSLVLSLAMVLTMWTADVSAASSGTTSNQPFSSGTGGSQNFRIPAMATTSSGEIIAATDARYTGTGDGYGLDTMVSYSMDNGSTWNYSYVNYNDDSSGYNGSASAFIDPALAINGSTVYLFAGLYPGGGVYIGNGKSGTGYTTVNGDSVLALYDSTSASSSTTPSYYVSNTANSAGYYQIYKYSDNSATSYYVDGEYDIYTLSNGSYTAVTGTQIDNSSATINANIFYTGDANKTGMYVLGTYYLTLRKGTINSDGSITWGSLSILNSQVKGSSESFYGIGPAGAIVTSTGRIVLPMYTYNTSTQTDGYSSVIYSDDNGSTWTRGANAPSQSSEASVSEVTVNGTTYLYMFARHGGYYVSSDMGANWSSKKSVSGISYYTGCQLSTLTYSKTIDGYPAILLSVPSNTSGRTNGKIFVGLVQTDGTINWKYNYQVNNSTYQYSDLVELSDGSIGILYENGSASEYYQTLAISTIASGATIGSSETSTVTYTASVSKTSATVDDTITLSVTASDGSDTSKATWVSSNTSVVSVNGSTATAVAAGTATLTATMPDGTTKSFNITVTNSGSGEEQGTSASTDKTIITTTTEGSTVYQLDIDGVDAGSEYVIYSANGDKILYNASGSSTTDQVTKSAISDTNYDANTTITPTSSFAVSTQLWTVESSGSGYKLKGNNSGTYLDLTNTTSTKANMSTAGTVLTITKSGTGNTVAYSYSGTDSYTSTTIDEIRGPQASYSSYVNNGFYYDASGTKVLITSLSCDRGTWTINNYYTVKASSITVYKNSGGSGTNYLVHSSTASDQFNTSSSTTGNVLYFFKKVTTVAGTTYTADNSKLLELITNANSLTEGDYSAASWSNLQTALTEATAIGTPAAQDTESAAQADQDKINTAAKNLNDAINALVKIKSVSVTVVVGNTATVENLSGTMDTSSLDKTIATAVLSNGILTVTGVKAGKTSLTIGDTTCNITVKPDTVEVTMDTTPFTSGTTLGASGKVTKLTTSVGLSYDINIDSSLAAAGGTWSIEDTSIATVDENGTVTGVKEGETTLTYTVDGQSFSMPVVIRSDATSTSSVKTYEFYVSEITNTTTYMAICNTTLTDMVEVQEGEAIYLSFATTDNTAIDFFAAPDDGYALTRMSSTNSAGHYMALSGNPLETDFATKDSAAGANQITSLGSTVVSGMISTAQGKGCDGGMGWTRGSDNSANVTSTLTFRSEKLPTVTKEVYAVGGETYVEGMNAAVGDKVVFKITVEKEAYEDAITYSDATLTDKLSGAVFENTSSSTKSITISSETSAETQTFYVDYTVKSSDLDTTITNNVDLNYTYRATYSSGSFNSTANANAKINALSFTPDNIVVDFGLPVTIDYSNNHGSYNLTDGNGTATYGTVTVKDNVVTYTPDKVIEGVDTVTITNSKNAEITFKVYPASTVYYEATDSFITYTGSWTKSTSTASGQNKAVLGSDVNDYGYDSVYSSTTDFATAASETSGDTASFTFTGTGMDLYAICAKETGKIIVTVKDSTGATKALRSVDTASINGTSDYTDYPEGNLYNVPVMSISGLTAGTYTVTVKKLGTDKVTLDGFKVYNTLSDSSVYAKDLEDNPSFIEVRNLNFGTIDLSTASSKYASDIYEQVYSEVTNTENVTAVITSSTGATVTASQDLIDNGPKNEIYLYEGMSLTLTANTEREVQLGLRGLQKAITCKIGESNHDVSTTDMFYTVKANGSAGTITITNPAGSGSILAVTKLKVCDDPSVIGAVTEESIMDTLYSLGFEKETAAATETVNLVDYTGKVLATVDLTANGTAGDNATFTASDIKAAAESVLPSGYAFVDSAFITDATVVFGENDAVNVQIGKVATLKITYKKGRSVVGTATLTHVQTSSSTKYTFTTSEIKAAAPAGYKVISLWGTSVKYGSTSSINATCR